MSQFNGRDDKEKKVVSRTRLRQRYAGILSLVLPVIGALGIGGKDVVEAAEEQPVTTAIMVAGFVLLGIFLLILSTRPDPKGEAKEEEERRLREEEVSRAAVEGAEERRKKYLE